MLKNSKMKSALVLVLAFVLLVAPSVSVYSQATGIDKVQDNELVINTLDDQGNISDIKVLSHLRAFGSGSAVIEDASAYKLSSVRNLYGKEKVESADGKIKVSVNVPAGEAYKDVYYLATLDKKAVADVKMPVSVKVKYFLDGKEMPASDIAGKSGHLKITCEMENLTGAMKTLEFKDKNGETVKTEATVFTPYVVSLSGWEFDNKKFSHVQAPGVSGVSPEGVVVDVQGKSTVSWSVPLVPPKYPAKQYTTLEADGKNITLDSFKIAIIPIVPTSSEVDSLGAVQASLSKLYDAFDSIQGGVGEPGKDATLLFGLSSLKDGLGQMSDGFTSLIGTVKMVRFGLSNPAFDAASFDSVKGTDAKGNKPGVKEAVAMSKAGLDSKLLPAFAGQKMVLNGLETFVGKPGTDPVAPTASSSVYNDVNYLKTLLKGTPAEQVIDKSINPKLYAIGTNVTVLRDGGTLLTPTGTMEFPASVTALEEGTKSISAGLGKAEGGLGMIVMGMGNVDAKGNPVQVMVNGKPGSILSALAFFKTSVDGKVIPGIDQIMDGTSKIGEGSNLAKDGITAGLTTMESVPAIVSALKDNASQANTFLGKPEGAEAMVAYVYQTPKVDRAAATMNYGLGLIALVLIILFAIGRPPKQMVQSPDMKA